MQTIIRASDIPQIETAMYEETLQGAASKAFPLVSSHRLASENVSRVLTHFSSSDNRLRYESNQDKSASSQLQVERERGRQCPFQGKSLCTDVGASRAGRRLLGDSRP